MIPGSNPPGDTGLVFVVDDEPFIVEVITAALRAAGFRAEGFLEPEGALQRAQQQAPDALISDVDMPGMTGFELADAITQVRPDCKVLLISGKALWNTGEMSPANTFHYELLPKPVPLRELVAKTKCLLSQ